jgi:hypothetical protein
LKGERYSCGEKDREYGIRTEMGGGAESGGKGQR